MSELDDLRARVAAAERVCHLVGITGVRMDTDRDKALTQAWSEWSREHRRKSLAPSDAEIETLAARRDVIRNNTLARLAREDRERLEEECRMTLLEAIYERQHEPDERGRPEACDRVDLPEDSDAICAGCGRAAERHPEWRRKHQRRRRGDA